MPDKPIGWIRSLKLWARAMDKAAREEPKFTRSYWRRVLEIYEGIGGQVIDDEENLGEDLIFD